MIIFILVTGWTSAIVINFPWNIFYILINFGQSIILCPFKPQMWHAYEDVFYGFWLCCVAFMVTIVVYSFFFLHVSTLWLFIPQFVQYLSVFPILLYVFIGVACLVLCGTKNVLLVSIVVIPSSHNITSSLCCNVDHFIPAVAILKYDCKFALYIIVNKLSMVGTYKPWANF